MTVRLVKKRGKIVVSGLLPPSPGKPSVQVTATNFMGETPEAARRRLRRKLRREAAQKLPSPQLTERRPVPSPAPPAKRTRRERREEQAASDMPKEIQHKLLMANQLTEKFNRDRDNPAYHKSAQFKEDIRLMDKLNHDLRAYYNSLLPLEDQPF